MMGRLQTVSVLMLMAGCSSAGSGPPPAPAPPPPPDPTRTIVMRAGFDIWVMDSLGGNLLNLNGDVYEDHQPSWSPDGKTIAFVSNRSGNLRIYLMAANGASPAPLMSPNGFLEVDPAWSPDGKKIAFAADRGVTSDIYVVGVDGMGAVRLTTDTAYDYSPTWSPDGSKIAFR
jgi:TolB protein